MDPKFSVSILELQTSEIIIHSILYYNVGNKWIFKIIQLDNNCGTRPGIPDLFSSRQVMSPLKKKCINVPQYWVE